MVIALPPPPPKPMWPRFDSGFAATRGLTWLMVLCSAPGGFSKGSSVSKFQFNRMQDLPENHFHVSGASGVNIIKLRILALCL